MDNIFTYFEKRPLEIIIDNQVKNYAQELILGCEIGRNFLIVSDVNTYKILGNKIEFSLQSLNVKSYIIDNKQPKADISEIDKIKDLSKNCDAIIAVGSGTVSDLCKYASFLNNIPYVVFATAPSMNGYCSANASISFDGFKNTVKAHLPKALFCDVDILCAAPLRLIQSGLGDSICRPTAQSDWLLSHILLDTKYDDRAFKILETYEADLFDNSADLVRSDQEVIELLMKTLIASGLGMYLAGSSSPASQGEHMLAHAMEMAFKPKLDSFHGEQIAITTIFMSDLIEKNLKSKPNFVVDCNFDHAKIFCNQVAVKTQPEYDAKLKMIGEVDNFNHKISLNWDNVINEIDGILIKKNKLESILKNAKLNLNCESIGWNLADFCTILKVAKYTRNRFTFLDLV